MSRGAALHRGTISMQTTDAFNDTKDFGSRTTLEGMIWRVFQGVFTGASGKASYGANNPAIAGVDIEDPNIDLSATLYTYGGDALYFRIKDANNWMRLRMYGYDTAYTTYCNGTQYTGNSESQTYFTGACGTCTGGVWNWTSSSAGCATTSGCPGSCPACTYGFTCSGAAHNTCSLGAGCSSTTCSYACGTGYNYYTTLYFEKCVNGVVTQITNYGLSWGATGTLRVTAQGDAYSVYWNGSNIFNVSDAANDTNTIHGIGSGPTSLASSQIQNFSLKAA